MNKRELDELADEIERLRALHEGLGDRYLAMMRARGIKGPEVQWLTKPPSMDGVTSACIVWDDRDEIVYGPRDMLADLVAAVVVRRHGAGAN